MAFPKQLPQSHNDVSQQPVNSEKTPWQSPKLKKIRSDLTAVVKTGSYTDCTGPTSTY